MLFNNKISVDKNQQKLYNKGREIIENRASGLEHSTMFQESQDTFHRGLTTRPVSKAALRRQMFGRRSNIINTVSHKLFMESLFDLYNESLLLDDDFKRSNENNLFNLCNETLNNLIEEGYTSWDTIKNNSSLFTEKLYGLCEAVAKDKAEDITMDTVKKQKVSDSALINEKDKDEEVTEDDKKKVDDETKDDKKNVSEVIKDKVTDTIKKEKEKSEKELEDEEDVKENSKTDKEKEEEEADSTEDDNDDTSTDGGDEEETKDDEDKESSDSNDDEKEDDEDKDDEKAKSESFSFNHRLRKPNKIKNTSLFRSIELNITNKFFNEKANGIIGEDVEVNMDMIFAESLAYYTLLETFNTIGIIDLRPSQLKNICKELILK